MKRIYPRQALNIPTYHPFLKIDASWVTQRQVFEPPVAQAVNKMLQSSISEETGYRARVLGYHVAGKTETVSEITKYDCSDDSYVAVLQGYKFHLTVLRR